MDEEDVSCNHSTSFCGRSDVSAALSSSLSQWMWRNSSADARHSVHVQTMNHEITQRTHSLPVGHVLVLAKRYDFWFRGCSGSGICFSRR